MNIKAYLIGTHYTSFRRGEPAEIIGVEFVTPEGLQPRPCYKIRYEDGVEDAVPIADANSFTIVSADEIHNVRAACAQEPS